MTPRRSPLDADEAERDEVIRLHSRIRAIREQLERVRESPDDAPRQA